MTEIKANIDFIQLAKDVACIKQAVLGNGEPGICHRVDALETELKKQQRSQGWISGFCGGLGFVAGGFIQYLINYFKGG